MGLRLGADLDFPLRAVTEPIGIFANRGKGKSSTSRRFIEQLYAAGLPSVVIDIKGDHYGIRSSRDGKSPGLPFVIFGGEHGDVPLEEGSGAIVARFIAEQRIPAVIDLSEFSKTKARRWVMEFAEELYRVNREPLMFVVDEADVIIPQRLSNDLLRLLGALEDIAKRGRQRGLGITVVSQRVQDVNKSVTELLETLLLGAITGPRMRKAIMEWIDDHADPEEAKSVIASLSTLDVGEVWVWSPGFLRLLARARVDLFETFDSFKTPEPGQARRIPRTMADVDLAHVSAEITATIERAKADDPAELRKQVSERDARIDALATRLRLAQETLVETGYFTEDEVGPDIAPRIFELWTALRDKQPERVEVPVPLLEEELLDKFEGLLSAAAQVGAELAKRWEETLNAVDAGRRAVEAADVAQRATQPAPERATKPRSVPRVGGYPSGNKTAAEMAPPPASVTKPKQPRGRGTAASLPDDLPADLRGIAQKVLDAVAWLESMSLPTSKVQVGQLAGYRVDKRLGGRYGKTLAALKAADLIDYTGPGLVNLTAAGRNVAQMPDIERTSAGLQAAIMAQLDDIEQRVLRVLIDAYPADLSKVDAGQAAGYQVDARLGGRYGKALARLRALGLIVYPASSRVAATSALFVGQS